MAKGSTDDLKPDKQAELDLAHDVLLAADITSRLPPQPPQPRSGE
jgi:hypothetical protein